MVGKTHIAGGVLAGELVYLQQGSPAIAGPILLAAVIGSLMPDIDKPGTTISSANTGTKLTAVFLNVLSCHRGFCHTIVCGGLLTGILYYFGVLFGQEWIKPIAWAFAAGFLSHLILDTLNPMGIMWLWPFSTYRIHVANIRTSGVSEEIIRDILFVLCCWELLYIFPQTRDALDAVATFLRSFSK